MEQMNFEQPELTEDFPEKENPTERKIEDENEEIESIFGKSLRCFKRWGRVGLAAGAIFVLGEMKRETMLDDKEYNDYISASFSKEQLKAIETDESEILNIFGDNAVSDIKYGDRESFFERKSKNRKEPEFKGFAGRGFIGHAEAYFTEKYLYFPKGWIAGEVDQVEFVDSIKQLSQDRQMIEGGKFKVEFISHPKIYLRRQHDKQFDIEGAMPIRAGTIEHELGHANDWETDMDLNIIDREELLLKVHKRLTAPDSYHRGGDDHYHEMFMDGSKRGLYRATREYWAEICAQYFLNPKSFLKDFPEDFKLVDCYAKKNDPSYDVFNKNRGQYDPDTGQLRDFWKDK